MFSKGVKIDRGDPKKFNLIQRKVDRAEKMSPTIREDLDSQLQGFDEMGHDSHKLKTVAPDRAMKQIDTSFESFFYQRPYTLPNFNFYLQVLA